MLIEFINLSIFRNIEGLTPLHWGKIINIVFLKIYVFFIFKYPIGVFEIQSHYLLIKVLVLMKKMAQIMKVKK